jgi:YVTN family beta-propeller protein
MRINRDVILAGAMTLALAMNAQAAGDHLLLAISQGESALKIYKVDGRTLSEPESVPIGKGAREVCVSADGGHAYVSNDKDNTVTVVDLETKKATATIDLPGLKRPDGCATSPDSKKLYVAASDSETIVVISTVTNKILKQVKVGKEPRRIVFTPDGRRIFVSSEVSDEITILNPATDTVIDKMKSGGHGPRTMVFMPDKQTMLVTNVDDDTVSFVKFAEKRTYLTIGAGGSPQRIELSADGKTAFVLAVLESKISVINMGGEHIRATKFIPVGKAPWGMAASDDKKLIYVASAKENSVAAYGTGTLEQVMKVTVASPSGLAFR